MPTPKVNHRPQRRCQSRGPPTYLDVLFWIPKRLANECDARTCTLLGGSKRSYMAREPLQKSADVARCCARGMCCDEPRRPRRRHLPNLAKNTKETSRVSGRPRLLRAPKGGQCVETYKTTLVGVGKRFGCKPFPHERARRPVVHGIDQAPDIMLDCADTRVCG